MKFLRSGILSLILLAAGSAGAFAFLNPDLNAIGNYQMQQYAPYAGWGIGVVAAFISLLGMGLLHGIRRLLSRKRSNLNQALIILLCVGPWLVFSWQLLGEPRFTAFARAVIDFAARPLFWGALLSVSWTVMMLGLSFIPAKK